MTIKFTPEEAAEIIRQHVLTNLVKAPKGQWHASVHCPDNPATEISVEVWDEEVEGE